MQEPSSRTVRALLAFTFVTGLIDAASLLGLAHVFVANMTGNIVFIGFSLLGQGESSLEASMLALGGFLLGALSAGRALAVAPHRGLRTALGGDVALLAVAAA